MSLSDIRWLNLLATTAIAVSLPVPAMAEAKPDSAAGGAAVSPDSAFRWERAESYRLPQPENYGALTRRALRFSELISHTVKKAKQPGFTSRDWAPLAALVAVDKFERVGAHREKMSWAEYTEFLTAWASETVFNKTLRGVTEVPNRVFIELEERNETAGRMTVVNSLSIYDFDEHGKIKHLDIYLQRDP